MSTLTKMIRILTTLYNAKPFITKCINSIRAQNLREWKCYVLNDLSTDGSEQIVTEIAKKDKRIVLINNPQKLHQVGAYLNALLRRDIDNEDICVTVDGDDWLPNKDVLTRIKSAYADGKTWITWGSMLVYENDKVTPSTLCQPITDWTNLRTQKWVTSHLRTWKAFLYRAINPADLLRQGRFWPMAGDQAFMLPMLEMAGPEHSKYLSEMNYVYNNQNPLNDHTVDHITQLTCCEQIRKLPPYGRLIEISNNVFETT